MTWPYQRVTVDYVCIDCGVKRRTPNRAIPPQERCRSCKQKHQRREAFQADPVKFACDRATRYRGQKVYTDADLLDAVRKVADDGRVTALMYDQAVASMRGMPSRQTISWRFGGWTAAVEAAGLKSGGRRGPYRNRVPVETCLTDLRRAAEFVGHIPSSVEYEQTARHLGLTCVGVVRRELGGWANAVTQAFRYQHQK